jgi:TatD DNase family protein
MRFIDTHCHLYSNDFKADSPEMIRRALDAGVAKCFLPNIDIESVPDMLALELAYPGTCFPMMGLHPCHVKADFRDRLREMRQWFDKRAFAGVGETGLDFHWDLTYREEQVEAFQVQVEWAIQFELPLVIHSRKSLDECIGVVRENQDGRLRGIFHCFSGTVEQAKAVRDLGFHMGIGGVVTYKNGGLEPVLQALGLDRIVLETDAPYLSPVPHRGKRNEPAYLPHIAGKIAEILGTTVAEVAEQTTRNAEKLFSMPQK